MDEPLSNLDAKLRVQIRAEVSRIQRRLGVATIYVTHDQIEAMTMGDRVTVMREGVVQQCGTPQILYDHPDNLFVAAFIGSPAMNLWNGQLDDSLSSLRLGSQTISLPEAVGISRPGLTAFKGRPVVVGLRPEHLPAATGEAAVHQVLDGDIDLVEALGSELLVHFSIDASRVVAEGSLDEDEQLTLNGEGVAKVDCRVPVKPGTRGRFAVDVGRMQFFDPSSGGFRDSLLNPRLALSKVFSK